MKKAGPKDAELYVLLDEIEKQHDQINTLLFGECALDQIVPQVYALRQSNIEIRLKVRHLLGISLLPAMWKPKSKKEALRRR